MRIAVNIFLPVLLVFIQTPVVQLFKLPKLIEHFSKHQQRDNVTLAGFLQEHYNTNHRDADWPEDEQLPFKNMDFYSIGYAIVPVAIGTNISIRVKEEKKIILPHHFAAQQDLASIFHPPRS